MAMKPLMSLLTDIAPDSDVVARQLKDRLLGAFKGLAGRWISNLSGSEGDFGPTWWCTAVPAGTRWN